MTYAVYPSHLVRVPEVIIPSAPLPARLPKVRVGLGLPLVRRDLARKRCETALRKSPTRTQFSEDDPVAEDPNKY